MQLQLFDTFPEQPGDAIIEKMVRQSNLLEAYQRVKRNGGAPGIDGMTVEELGQNLDCLLSRARAQIVSGTYRPQPVKATVLGQSAGTSGTAWAPSPDMWIKIDVGLARQAHNA